MRSGIIIAYSPTKRCCMDSLGKDCNAAQKHVWRARVVLLSAERISTGQIMRRTGRSKTCVWRWQERVVEKGYEGMLCDKARLSRIPPLAP